jgi:hypothetical protein
VVVKPLAVRQILGPDRAEITSLLHAVPTDVDLWNASDSDLAHADEAWQFFRRYDGIDEVIAGKVLARKRPRLIPIIDAVVIDALQAPANSYWATYREVLTEERRGGIEKLRPPSVPDSITTLRILDVALWMRYSGGTNAKAVRKGLDVA